MTSARRATDPGTGLWNGVHYLVNCADGCGSTVVVTEEYVGRDVRCASHGREHRGAPVPQRPQPGETRYNGLRIGQPGESMPGHLDPDRLTRAAEVAPGRIVERGREVFMDGPDVLPAAAVTLCRRVGGRMLLSRARRADGPRTAAGKPSAGWDQVDTWLSVQWRPEGKPPTIMAFWRNGKRDRAMVAGVEMSHTAAGAR